MMTSILRATAALLAAIVLSMTLATASAALAASPKGQQPGGHLKISEVFVDFTNDVILISGEDLDFGPGPLTVTLGDPDLIAAGSIVCTPDFVALPQAIECDFSTPGLPDDGDYLLTVATGAGQSQSDEYDLTIGAVGPVGDTGAKGDTGDTGAKGDTGDTGDTGPKGDTGDTGAKGDTGDTGSQGEPGEPAPPRDQGRWRQLRGFSCPAGGNCIEKSACNAGELAVSGMCGNNEVPFRALELHYSGLSIVANTFDTNSWTCKVKNLNNVLTLPLHLGVFCIPEE